MGRPLSVKIVGRAALQIRDAAKWWGEHREKAPGALKEELERAFALLSQELDRVRGRESAA